MKKRSKKAKRENLEWVGLIVIVVILYFTGWYKPIITSAQRALLWTGILNPRVEQVAEAKKAPFLTKSDYNLTLARYSGELTQLKKFKGKVVFINLWASWCPPCVAEMPTIEDLYKQVSDNENIKFLLISLDRNYQKAANFMKERNFPMPYYFPKTQLPAELSSATIPATFVISKEGKIIYQRTGISNYSSDSFRKWLVKQSGL